MRWLTRSLTAPLGHGGVFLVVWVEVKSRARAHRLTHCCAGPGANTLHPARSWWPVSPVALATVHPYITHRAGLCLPPCACAQRAGNLSRPLREAVPSATHGYWRHVGLLLTMCSPQRRSPVRRSTGECPRTLNISWVKRCGRNTLLSRCNSGSLFACHTRHNPR